MDGFILSIALAIVVIFLKLEVRRQGRKIERLQAAVRELNPGLNLT